MFSISTTNLTTISRFVFDHKNGHSSQAKFRHKMAHKTNECKTKGQCLRAPYTEKLRRVMGHKTGWVDARMNDAIAPAKEAVLLKGVLWALTVAWLPQARKLLTVQKTEWETDKAVS